MAVVSTPLGTTLVVQYQAGLTDTGAPVIRRKSLTGIKSNAADQDIYEAAAALFNLIEYPLISVRRDNSSELTDQ